MNKNIREINILLIEDNPGDVRLTQEALKEGREVLSEIKTNPRIKHIPIVVLTTSEAEPDIINTYQLHANCYITKPVDINRFIEVIRGIENFWFNIVTLPSYTR